ncbi:MAG: hypothetical protein H6810_08250 [Phycisphaeraceae bacterium]|nr:MAG: hypothetical protein H6810_08250 [Phycisphaeraceae bacterium]
MTMHAFRLALGCGLIGAAAPAALAGTPTWSNTLGTPGMTGSYVASFATYDDGTGNALYAIGQFGSAGGAAGTQNLAKWNGSAWESVGGGLINQFANCLAVYQGSLIAGGYFDSAGGVADTEKLARWDGTAWHSMDAVQSSFLDSMWDFQVFDDGSGEKLFIAGNYVDLGGISGLSHLATWDGTNYAPVGATIGGAVPLIVLDLAVADLGSGPHLYAGGRFLEIGGVAANNIAMWDGAAWHALGGGLTQSSGFAQVITMTEFDDGNGPALYAGGSFQFAGGNPAVRVAKWDGTNWSPVGAGFQSTVQELTVFDDGNGPALYAVGSFAAAAGGIDHIAKWNGASWEQVGAGADANCFGAIVADAGEGTALHIGGSFANAGGLASNRVVSLIAAGGGCNLADVAEPYGVLDLADVQAFIAAFVSGDPLADLVAPFGVLDLADVQAFISEFVGGCP